MFTQIIINDQNIFSCLHPLFAYSTSGIRCDILQRCQLTGCSCNYRSVIHSSVLFKSLYKVCHGRSLLTDGNIDTEHIVLILLIYDSIYSDSRLSCLTVADDKLTLSASYRHHGVDSLDTRLKRGIY